ncbi:hypothetical protein AAZX31_15G250400 [Glycine max]|uniref:RING-type E3 ubiquitin transferase n=1 Tax=Glycine max TaxID=3847 RepID=I1MJI5_SOYBN|nr:E3 ubiquitin-protein ligase RNF181 [Glycine max]KAG4950555.1 hypothetical protein JHK86_043794 [Glycine max]KAG4958082.1 hypothetical protein JHK85_044462 [Glycine max]KAG5106941.1 hypothetical protein JHK82_043911 [Glycine max]KAG5117871.1 hypothetical protein JHK84_043984 [Glycine max]KAH1149020.1 hypothetical protein GYH30_043579 [Glycine max]|eukprot:XP_003546855.1 E3 ubiquitin-protein ligase RNF181 [Glycine max]
MAATATAEAKTYWCHECDMSVSLTLPPSPLLCPHCHTHFLELMDSPSLSQENDAESSLFDVVFQDALLLLNPNPNPNPKPLPSKPLPLPSLHVTPSLLSSLDPNGVVLCAVCKDQITLNAQAKQLPCQHLYHSDCITPWIELNSSCPLCRFRLEEEEEEGGDADADADAVMTEIRREIIARLTELTEEDFYGLRTTLSHIASRHALIEENQNHRAQIGEPRGGGGGGGGDSAC